MDVPARGREGASPAETGGEEDEMGTIRVGAAADEEDVDA